MQRRPKTIGFWNGRLPHWEVEDGRYFITIHLAGAIPAGGRERLRAISLQIADMKNCLAAGWLRLQRRIFAEMERWLDRATWNSFLNNPFVAEMVVEAIAHRDQRGDWQMFEYVIMPTHIHLFCEIGSRGLKATVEDFKRWTGHRATKILEAEGESFWQNEWFDHWSRSDEEDDRIVSYIRNNPVKANLVSDAAEWPYTRRSRLPGAT